MHKTNGIYIGTAGWSIPTTIRNRFEEADCLLSTYSTLFHSVEINSSFYRHHKPATYERWAQQVPKDFRFSIKLSRNLTHELRLKANDQDFAAALLPLFHLKEKLGCLLVQLPPSLDFKKSTAEEFFGSLRKRYSGLIVCEPRHLSWSSDEAQQTLITKNISFVEPDPILFSLKNKRAGSPIYYRLHGSPQTYESAYPPARLRHYCRQLRQAHSDNGQAWCIFDNTKFGHATADALKTRELLMTAGRQETEPMIQI